MLSQKQLELVILTTLVWLRCCLGAWSKSNACFSCMSPMYEDLFRDGALDRFFNRPRNFTSQCDEPMNPHGLAVVNCRTICLTLQQQLVVMGQPTGRKLWMRGCALTLTRRGLYNHTLALFDRFDVCRDMNAADLLRYDDAPHWRQQPADPQRVRVCSCLGDRCNGASRSTPFSGSSLYGLLTSPFFILLASALLLCLCATSLARL